MLHLLGIPAMFIQISWYFPLYYYSTYYYVSLLSTTNDISTSTVTRFTLLFVLLFVYQIKNILTD